MFNENLTFVEDSSVMTTNRNAIAILLAVFLAISAAYAQGPAAELFKAKCAMCHGPDAAGKTPMGAKFNIPRLALHPEETGRGADPGHHQGQE
jgi:mono/diheme cytochrome c family protein